jgi:hypothetical protein
LAWGAYQYFVARVKQQLKKNRIALTDLRDEGTQIRINGMAIKTEQQLDAWWITAEAWDHRVVQVIAVIDEPDSRQYATLGYPGVMRDHSGVNFISNQHMRMFTMHDRREVRLEKFIDKYSELSARIR